MGWFTPTVLLIPEKMTKRILVKSKDLVAHFVQEVILLTCLCATIQPSFIFKSFS
jgi:hypothetical protein